jgi:hypothetical protein
MKNDKQLIWGAAIVLIIIPYFSYLFNFAFAYFTGTLDQMIDGYKAMLSLVEDSSDFLSVEYFASLFGFFPTFIHLLLKPILTLIGIARFKQLGTKRILFFLLLMSFIATSIGIVQYIYSNWNILSEKSQYIVYAIYEFIILLIGIVIPYFACKYLSEKIVIRTNSFDDIHQAIAQEKTERFWNYMVDIFMSLFLILPLTTYFYYRFSEGRSNPFYQMLFMILFFVLYYTLTEGLFKVTFGKIITKSTVIDEKGEIISFDKSIGRTLCRLIPFEPFSFLLKERGWHDSITDTYVVKTE